MTALSHHIHKNFIAINFVMDYMANNQIHQIWPRFITLQPYKTSLSLYYNKN